MLDGCRLIWSLLIGLFRSRAALGAENLVLRQHIIVLRRRAPERPSFNALDRLILVNLYRLFPAVRSALTIVRSGPSFDGIGQDFEPTGVGNRGRAGDDQRSRSRSGSWSVR